jgi:Ca2+-transporting ATPase
LALVGVGVAILVSALGLLRGESLRDMLLMAVSIAVAVVPEGLPAVVTITLALGAQRMLKRNALIRKLPAVETLGSTTVICSDKTGTLTENRMTVVLVDVAGHRVELVQPLRRGMPALDPNVTGSDGANCQAGGVRLLLAAGALCNDAVLARDTSGQGGRTTGDPTEAALLVAAAQAKLLKNELEAALPRVAEAPFDSDRKRMTTVHELAAAGGPVELPPEVGTHVAFTKGAVDGLVELSTAVWSECRSEPLNDEWKARIHRANDELADQGMRVLGVAFRALAEAPDQPTPASLETELVFVGMVGIIDPPRAEVKDAVAMCQTAGIRPIMITGDHPKTARKIATDLGISKDGRVLAGDALERIDDATLAEAVGETSVYARVSPEHKLRIVQALQSRGQVVAMTGDGVNDAPALKRAEIGVSMGVTGTDVAKEASDMVLQDDNFATIVSAVQEGRTIYDNLRKFVKFSVAGNLGKVVVMLLAPMPGMPLPLTPLQLLWLNLLTDGLLGLGLGVEPPERGVMQRPPYSPQAGVFSDGGGRHVLWVGLAIGAVALGLGYAYWLADPNGNWQTMIFTTLALAQVAQALAARSSQDSLFTLGLRSNLAATLIVAFTLGLQLTVVYVPFFQDFFGTKPLTPMDLALSVLLSSVVFVGIELEKWRRRAAARS